MSAPPNLQSAVVVFGPLRGRPDCSVHLGGVSLPLVPQYRHLGVTLAPTFSCGPHVDLVFARGDRLFHQACAWCRGEGLPLSFSSSVFVTYVLSSSSFGSEFVCDDSAALQQLNLSRRWCRHLLGWPSAFPVAAVHWELGIGDALLLALGRAFSLFGRLCAMDHSSSCPPDPASIFRLCSTVQSTWSHWCASALRALSIPHPGNVGISLGSPLSAVRRWLSREAIPRLDRDLRLRLAAMASGLHGVRVAVSSDNFLPARENPVYSFNLSPSAVRLWRLARWGHDLSSTGRPPTIGLGLPLAPSAMMWTVLSHIISPPAPPTTMPAKPGLTLAASHRPTFQRMHGTAGCSTHLTS